MQPKPAAFTREKLYPYLVLVIAALTRLPQITWRSFDGDEGVTILFSQLPYRDLFVHMIDLTFDRHPMLIYVFIKLWRGLVGEADVALRLLPVLLGMLTVALIYRIGAKSFGRRSGAIAALLFALNPLVVFQHLDVRMYAPALFLIALAVWLSMRAPEVAYPQKGLLYFIMAIAAVIAMYLHVLVVTLLPVLVVLLLRDLRQRLPWVEGGVLAAIGLAILPYFYQIYQTGSQGGGAVDAVSWYRTLLGGAKTLFDSQAFLNFSGNELFLTLLFPLIIGLALWRNWQHNREWTLFYIFWLVTALGLTIYVMMSIESFVTKPFVFTAVPLSLLMGSALGGKRPLPTLIPLTACLILFGGGLIQLWQPENVGEDFRSAGVFINEQAGEQDAVIIHLNWYQSALDRYLDRPVNAPFSNNVQSVAEVEAGFAPFLDSEVIWLVQAGVDAASTGLPDYQGDQERLVQSWLESRFPLVTEVHPGGISVKAYALDYRQPALPHAASPLNVPYGDVTLVGYRLANDTFPARDRVLHPPSTWVPVTLYWSVDAPLPTDVVPRLTLEDDFGAVWGGNLTRDNDLRRFHPPLAWQPGAVVRWDFDVVVNPEVAPGVYKLVVRLLDGDTMTPIPHDGTQDWFIVALIALE